MPLTPMKAIRAKCLDCMCGSAHEVRLCPCPSCPLYAYRFGKRPRVSPDTGEAGNELNPTATPQFQPSESRNPTPRRPSGRKENKDHEP